VSIPNFFVTAEEQDDSSLQGKAVVVGDLGMVISSNEVAQSLGALVG
jgi:hypothetical protein